MALILAHSAGTAREEERWRRYIISAASSPGLTKCLDAHGPIAANEVRGPGQLGLLDWGMWYVDLENEVRRPGE